MAREAATHASHARRRRDESLATTQTALGRILPNAASEETTHREAEQTLARRPRSAFHRLRHPSSPLPKPVRFSESTCSTSAAAAARDWPSPNRSWHRACFAASFSHSGALRREPRSQPSAKAPSYRAPKRLQSASFAPVSTESSRGASVGAAMPDRAALRSSARASRWSATSGFFARSGPCR